MLCVFEGTVASVVRFDSARVMNIDRGNLNTVKIFKMILPILNLTDCPVF